MNETILEEAQRIIYGDRERTYGHPSKNFDATADFWNAWITAKYGAGGPVLDCFDVAMMMALLKMAREAHLHKRDNLVDLCGYTACIQKILDHEESALDHETGDDLLHGGSQTHPAGTVSPEDVQSVRWWPGGPLVLGDEGRPVGGVEIQRTPEAVDYKGSPQPLDSAVRLAQGAPG